VRVQRPDGSDLPAENFWLTDRTFVDGQRPIRENLLHLFDYNTNTSSSTYTLYYASAVDIIPPDQLGHGASRRELRRHPGELVRRR